MGRIAGITSGGGTVASLVETVPAAGRGGRGIAFTPSSEIGFLALGTNGGVGVGRDGLE